MTDHTSSDEAGAEHGAGAAPDAPDTDAGHADTGGTGAPGPEVPDPDAPAPEAPDGGLVLTGERTLPGIPDEAYWFARHEVAYRFAAARAEGRAVLDAGCGEGYGLAMLADADALRVVGVDLDPQVVDHAAATYASHRPGVIEVHRAELMDLPLGDDDVDLTVSFQVIEHLHDIPGYLASLVRVTRPGGEVLIATPNRLTFSPGADTPTNPFHTREFTAAELRDELSAAGLEVLQVLGVRHGARLRSVARVTGRPFTELMTTRAPEDWPGWYRRVVHRVRAGWFDLSDVDVDASLDLVAVCTVP